MKKTKLFVLLSSIGVLLMVFFQNCGSSQNTVSKPSSNVSTSVESPLVVGINTNRVNPIILLNGLSEVSVPYQENVSLIFFYFKQITSVQFYNVKLKNINSNEVPCEYTQQGIGDLLPNGGVANVSLGWQCPVLENGARYRVEIRFVQADSYQPYGDPFVFHFNFGPCPENFIPVPALAGYTENSFCIAKYEMKKGPGNLAVAKADGLPWVSINRDTSSAACSALGSAYHLITNAEWQTVARNIESVGFNWSGGQIGNAGGLSRGHSDGTPLFALAATTTDNDSCFGTLDTCSLSVWHNQRRVHQLTNGSYIWDFSGNIWEWVTDNNSTIFGPEAPIASVSSATHSATGNIGGLTGNAKFHFGPAGNYTNSVYSTSFAGMGVGYINFSQGAVVRGGSRSSGLGAGIFSVSLDTPNYVGADVGFRCAWTP